MKDYLRIQMPIKDLKEIREQEKNTSTSNVFANVVHSECLDNKDCEMGGESEGDEERIRAPQLPVLSSNGSLDTKPHGKQFYDDGVIPHSVIPRKLRSAMKKRARKHVSLPNDRKKQRHSSNEVERPQLHNSKKSGQNMPGEFSLKPTMSESFTQDEQEVAETLYRLAKMFLNNKPIKRRAYRRTKVAKSSPLQEMSESCILAPEGLPAETVKENRHFAKSSARENPPNLNLGLDSYAFQPESNDVANMTVSSKFFPGTRTVQSMQHESPLPDHKQHNGLIPVASIMGKQKILHPIVDSKESRVHVAYREGDLPLWPALSTTMTCTDEEVHTSSMRSMKMEAPVQLDYTSASGHGSTESTSVREKIHSFVVDNRLTRKGCPTHVYISHFIQSNKNIEKVPGLPVPPEQLNPIGRPYASSTVVGSTNVTDVKYSTEVCIQHTEKGLQQDQQQTSTISGKYNSLKQSSNFLSLSVKGNSLESTTLNGNLNQLASGSMTSEKHRSPYHFINQHQPSMPFPLPQAWYAASYPELLRAEEAHQQTQCQNGSLYSPSMGYAGSAKQQQQQPPQTWEAQVASKFLSEGNLSNFPKWQNGRHEPPSQASCSQLEKLGAKFLSRAQQQHLFITPSPQSSTQHHLPGGFEESSTGFHTSSAPYMQLLCNTDS